MPVPPALVPVLDQCLSKVRPALQKSAFVFVHPEPAKQKNPNGRYNSGGIAHIVQTAGNGANVTGRHFAHRWRHTYATSLLRRGVDIHVVQRLLGHANIATTIRYLHLSDADLTDAVNHAFPDPDRTSRPPGRCHHNPLPAPV